MTGRRQRWLLAGVAAVAALLCLGGVALAGSLLSGSRAPLIEKGGAVVPAHVFDRTSSRTPADDQYGNPLEGKLCAGESDIHFTMDRAGPPEYEVQTPVSIHNCGDVSATISPPQKGDPASPFHPELEAFENAFHCPVTSGTLTLGPGQFCVIFVVFPGLPWPPPGDYSDTLTFPGDVASVTVHLSGTVPASDIRLVSPQQDAVIPQNVPSIGCPADPARGYGFVIEFAWTASEQKAIVGYQLESRSSYATIPIVSATVSGTSYTYLSCNGFVDDVNLDGWYWRVRTVDDQGNVGAWTQATFSFAPCRLADRTACYAAP